MATTKSDWKIKPITNSADKIDLRLTFTNSDFEKIRQGFKPKDMDDRWFIYSEDLWVNFHRSWMGDCIFRVRFDKTADDTYTTVECWVERNEKIYGIKDDNENRRIIEQIIKDRLLN